mmetsp:Transcript_22771/g.71437  ORF Transcript_22771/g.71437 Transcript_22771/m.71437 type:complete len:279 (+) Transcript_22771:89-925(+)
MEGQAGRGLRWRAAGKLPAGGRSLSRDFSAAQVALAASWACGHGARKGGALRLAGGGEAPWSRSWRAGGVGRMRGGTHATGTGRGVSRSGREGPFGAPPRRPPGPVWTVFGGVEESGGRCDGRLWPSYHPLTTPGRGGLTGRRQRARCPSLGPKLATNPPTRRALGEAGPSRLATPSDARARRSRRAAPACAPPPPRAPRAPPPRASAPRGRETRAASSWRPPKSLPSLPPAAMVSWQAAWPRKHAASPFCSAPVRGTAPPSHSPPRCTGSRCAPCSC